MSWFQSCVYMKDSDFLRWLVQRLVNVYHESEGADFVTLLGEIADEVEKQENVWD